MASISKPLGTDRHGKKIYQVSWREPGGKQRHKKVHGLQEAKKFKAEIEHQLNVGQYIAKDGTTLIYAILSLLFSQKS